MVLILNHINSDVKCEQSLSSRFGAREKSPIMFGILALEKIIQLSNTFTHICSRRRNFKEHLILRGSVVHSLENLHISESVKSNNEALIWSNFLSAKTDFCTYLIWSSFTWSSSSSFTSSAIKSFLTLLGHFCKSSQFSSNRSFVDAVFCIDQNH